MSGIRDCWNAFARWISKLTAGRPSDATSDKPHYCPQCRRWVPRSHAANSDSCQLCDGDEDGDGIDDEDE
ncbi:MAG: hypothetical protein AMXMBFR47_32260 [Planctomycetota bacterium]